MSYQPVTPISGIAGWNFLNRTMERQSDSFRDSAAISRETAYFRDRIGEITSAKDLVADRQLLKVALGAFGLGEDVDKRYFVRKVLEEGTVDPSSMANRLIDKRYARLTDAFGFGSPFGARTGRSGFAGEITSAYEIRQFEIAVGEQNEPLRFALSFRREIAVIAEAGGSVDTGWFSILASAPMRQVVELAFNLPGEFASLDLDKQVGILKDKSRAMFGDENVSLFKSPEKVEGLVSRYLAQADHSSATASTSSASAALTLLQSGQTTSAGSGTLEALFAALY